MCVVEDVVVPALAHGDRRLNTTVQRQHSEGKRLDVYHVIYVRTALHSGTPGNPGPTSIIYQNTRIDRAWGVFQ